MYVEIDEIIYSARCGAHLVVRFHDRDGRHGRQEFAAEDAEGFLEALLWNIRKEVQAAVDREFRQQREEGAASPVLDARRSA